MKREHVLGLAAAALLWCGWLAWLWQPAHQLRLHQQHLLHAIESRNWKGFSALLAPDYSDRWGGSKQETTALAARAFQQFFYVKLEGEAMELDLSGEIHERMRMAGEGGPFTGEIVARVNALSSPFTFYWVHRSSWPWDWKLQRVEQPELQIDSSEWSL